MNPFKHAALAAKMEADRKARADAVAALQRGSKLRTPVTPPAKRARPARKD